MYVWKVSIYPFSHRQGGIWCGTRERGFLDSEDHEHTLFCREAAYVAIYALFQLINWTEGLSIEQISYIFVIHILTYHDLAWQVMKTRSYNILFAKTYDYALIDLLASSIAPQVMPPWSTMAPSPFASLGIWEDNSRPPGISLESKIKKLHLENIPWNVNVSLVVPTVFLEVQSVVKRVTAQVHNFKS